jgi:hypothetical protein
LRVVNAFKTCCWIRLLKIKWTYRITNYEVFQRKKEGRLFLKIKKNRSHSWIGNIIINTEFVVNILEGEISRKEAVGRPRIQYLNEIARNVGADSYTAIKIWLATVPDGNLPTKQILKDKKKKKKKYLAHI